MTNKVNKIQVSKIQEGKNMSGMKKEQVMLIGAALLAFILFGLAGFQVF